ncbi:hypothetical protein ACFCYH_40865 [Streptomyces sp. NPDC056400]|uniref:hypothetical protein n=1 Tax=Streptomyces sp. NPDC056400 TaxID=3345808 RepID=UPI0035DFA50B
MTTSLFAPQGFALAGVVQVPTVDGPLKMRATPLRGYRLPATGSAPGTAGRSTVSRPGPSICAAM